MNAKAVERVLWTLVVAAAVMMVAARRVRVWDEEQSWHGRSR